MIYTLLYDARCPFCVHCASWVRAQQPAVALRVVPSDDAEARRRWGQVPGYGDELTVAADDGRVWTGADAFVTAMWCLARYRPLALTMSTPLTRGAARAFFESVSAHRGQLSTLFTSEECDGSCATA